MTKAERDQVIEVAEVLRGLIDHNAHILVGGRAWADEDIKRLDEAVRHLAPRRRILRRP